MPYRKTQRKLQKEDKTVRQCDGALEEMGDRGDCAIRRRRLDDQQELLIEVEMEKEDRDLLYRGP